MPIPFYVVAASLAPGNRIKHFYHSGGPGPSRLLDHPERFRDSGFDVSTGNVASLVDDHWEVRSGDRKLLILYQDGTLLFRVRADEEFLGWGGQHLSEEGWINPVATVESHLSFIHLYSRVLALAASRTDNITFTLRLSNAVRDSGRLFLTRYYQGGIGNVNNPPRFLVHDADAKAELVLPSSMVTSMPNRAAFLVLESFYSMFDADSSAIPFVVEKATGTEVDLESLSLLR